MNEKDDSAWVFDSLVGFLQGPIWSAPLMTFIDEKSLIFEADTTDSKEYRDIYQEYKNLVDLLLGCYMEDMGITPEQFEHACTVNKDTKIPVQFHHSLFEQIWAANEYEIFKNMMIQKNLELQLQALKMIEKKCGLIPASLTCDVTSSPEEELVMEELLHNANAEESVQDNPPELTTDEMLREEHERLKIEYDNQHAILESALKMPEPSGPSTSSEKQEPLHTRPVENLKLNKNTSDGQFKVSLESIPEKDTIILEKEALSIDKNASEEDIKKRQKYLKDQRDKLVALKKKARSQHLEKNVTRPSSARVVAEASINGQRDLNTSQPTDSSLFQVRKALAARLKAEVVHE